MFKTEFETVDKIKPNVGDLIEIDRGLYTHWAVYIGDRKVIQVTGTHGDISSKFAFVRCSKLEEVARSNNVRINNKVKEAKAKGLESSSPEIIVQNASAVLDKEVDYNIISKNCEHYVTEWRYGQGWSDQAEKALGGLQTISQNNFQPDTLMTLMQSPHLLFDQDRSFRTGM